MMDVAFYVVTVLQTLGLQHIEIRGVTLLLFKNIYIFFQLCLYCRYQKAAYGWPMYQSHLWVSHDEHFPYFGG